jgi:hypothetical protein
VDAGVDDKSAAFRVNACDDEKLVFASPRKYHFEVHDGTGDEAP